MVRFPQVGVRSGLSLTEVLIAMFVMAIGMISLLVLFPVGIINTKWALQDNRVAMAANNANALCESPQIDTLSANNYSLRTDPVCRTALQSPAARINPAQRPFYDTVLGQWKFGTTGPGQPVQGRFPSIFVDPVGATQWSPAPALVPAGTRLGYSIAFDSPLRVGPLNVGIMRPTLGIPLNLPIPTGTLPVMVQSLGIPRVYPSNLNALPGVAQLQARRMCVMTDDAVFEELGRTRRFNPAANQAVEPNIPFVQREYRYSWAYMFRFPQATDPSVVEMSVVVFAGRPMNRGNGVVSPPNEKMFLGHPTIVNGINRQHRTFIQGSHEVVIRVPNGQPSGIRRGDWVLDNTLVMPGLATNGLLTIYAPFSDRIVPLATGTGFSLPFITSGISNGYFYNVVSVSNVFTVAGTPVQVIELDRPAKADGYELVYMPTVVDVIEKSAGKMPARGN
jgi:hypothetical protein